MATIYKGVREAAAAIGASHGTVARWIRAGRLEARRYYGPGRGGGGLLIERRALIAAAKGTQFEWTALKLGWERDDSDESQAAAPPRLATAAEIVAAIDGVGDEGELIQIARAAAGRLPVPPKASAAIALLEPLAASMDFEEISLISDWLLSRLGEINRASKER